MENNNEFIKKFNEYIKASNDVMQNHEKILEILQQTHEEMLNILKVKEWNEELMQKAVYLGTKIEEPNEREILQIARAQKLNAYKMEMDDDNYILLPKIIF